jgi:hypothetical protein
MSVKRFLNIKYMMRNYQPLILAPKHTKQQERITVILLFIMLANSRLVVNNMQHVNALLNTTVCHVGPFLQVTIVIITAFL